MSSIPQSQPNGAAPVKRPLPSSLDRALVAARVADDNRGQDIVILDLRDLSVNFDFFVIVSGASRRQLHAISEEIDDVFKKQYGDKRLGIEGYSASRWILLDYGDVVVHMFEPETRAYYALEELWGAAPRVAFEATGGRTSTTIS